MSALLILGAGGHAKVVAETALASGAASSLAFLDDRKSTDELPTLLGWPVIGQLTHALNPAVQNHFNAAIVAIGHGETRLHWLELLHEAGFELPLLIHPSAWVSPSAQIGPGSAVLAQAAVQSQTRIGRGAILNTACSVDHDGDLAEGVHICPGAHLAGHVHIGARSWIGIGASVIQQITIGADVTVGAGAVVVDNLPDGITAMGIPARAR